MTEGSPEDVAKCFAALWEVIRDDPDQIDAVRAALDTGRGQLYGGADLLGDTFIVEATVHRGAVTEILRLRHRDLGQNYALKTLRKEMASNVVHTESLREEARRHLKLQHDHVLRAHALLRHADGRPALLLEWAGGGSLSRRLSGPITAKDARDVGVALLTAVAAIHAQGVVHADIVPANLLFAGPDWQSLKLADFGISTTGRRDGDRRTCSQFQAPEVDESRAPDAQSDLYACGKVIEVLLARLPADDPAEKLRQLAVRLTQADPANRPKSAAAAIIDLGR